MNSNISCRDGFEFASNRLTLSNQSVQDERSRRRVPAPDALKSGKAYNGSGSKLRKGGKPRAKPNEHLAGQITWDTHSVVRAIGWVIGGFARLKVGASH